MDGESTESTLKWVISAGAIAGTIGFAFAYFLLRRTYTQLGVRPDEVGWDWDLAIATFTFPALVLFLVIAAVTGVFLPRMRPGNWTDAAIYSIVVMVITLPLGILSMSQVILFPDRIAAGHEVTDKWFETLPLTAQCVTLAHSETMDPLLDAVDLPVQFRPSGPDHVPNLDDAAMLRPVLYLGRTERVAVYFDAGYGEVLRLPTSSVVAIGANDELCDATASDDGFCVPVDPEVRGVDFDCTVNGAWLYVSALTAQS